MSNRIHPTAIVDASVRLGRGNVIGPYCYVGPDVEMGNDNTLYAFVSIGQPPQRADDAASIGSVTLGDGNRMWEYVTINAATAGARTSIGSGCMLFAKSHVGHNVVIEDGVTIAGSVVIAGHVYVMNGANIGSLASIHQHQVIGAYAMIGMGAVVIKNLEVVPGNTYAGNPARRLHPNTVGMSRAGIDDRGLAAEMKRFEAISRQKTTG